MDPKGSTVFKKTTELLLASTAHGLPNIVRSDRKILKLMWLIFMIGSISACGYFVSRSIIEYLKYEVTTNINVIYEDLSEFPTVSFCSERNFSEPLSKAIMKCQFDFDYDCSTNVNKYFSKFNDPIGGLCYRFNSGKNMFGKKVKVLETTNSGLKSGLLLDLYVNISSNQDFNRIRILIHNSSSNPNSLLKNYRISSGSKNYFEVNRIFDTKLGEPYNNCLNDVTEFVGNKTLIDYISKINQSYSQDSCRQLFKNLKFKEIYNSLYGCDCKIVELDNVEEDCIFKEEFSDVSQCSAKAFNEIELILFKKELFNYCPLECDSISYEVSSFLVDYPGLGFINESEFKSFLTYERLKKLYFGIRVYYSANKYTLITQQPKLMLPDLVANIGGLLGLFIGVSFLSFIEIVEILLELTVVFVHKLF